MFESMRKPKCIIILLLLFSVGLFQKSENGLAAEKSKNSPSISAEEIIAQVDDERIDVRYLTSYLSTRPLPDYVQDVGKIVESRLDELIINEVLSQEALRIQLDQRPDVRYRIQQLLAQSVIEEMVNKPVYENKITDQELQAYYDEHINEFKRPAQVRLSDIFVSLDPNMTENQRKEKLELAENILADAKKAYGRVAFGKLVLKYSDSPSVSSSLNTSFFDIQGNPIGLDTILAVEAFKLEKTGQVVEHVIETNDGFHIIMLSGKRDALDKSLSKVKTQLTQRIRREKLEQHRRQYIDNLKANTRITVATDVVEGLTERLNEKITQQRTARPGSFPTLPSVAPQKTVLSRRPGDNQ